MTLFTHTRRLVLLTLLFTAIPYTTASAASLYFGHHLARHDAHQQQRQPQRDRTFRHQQPSHENHYRDRHLDRHHNRPAANPQPQRHWFPARYVYPHHNAGHGYDTGQRLHIWFPLPGLLIH